MFNLAAAASILLCAAVCLLWVRSYAELCVLDFGSRFNVNATNHSGSVTLTVFDYRGARRPRDGRLRVARLAYATAPPTPPPASFVTEGETRRGSVLGFTLTTGRPPGPAVYRPGPTVRPSTPAPATAPVALPIRYTVAAPFWAVEARHGAVALVFAASAVAARAAARRPDRRVAAGRCAACGYDLRGTPDRCPECGTIPTQRPPHNPPLERTGG